jgi:carboxyl-terminal processing protease
MIEKIDGAPTDGLRIDDAMEKLKGDPGSEVTLSIFRPRTGARRDYALEREIVTLDSVLGDARGDDDRWNFLLPSENAADPKIAYIRLTGFSGETVDELETALGRAKDQGMQALVLDLRFNPGGLLTAAVGVSDLFLREGRIVSVRGRNTPERVYDARPAGTFEDFPIVVLVNRYSASASEIVAACLQDHGRAVILGERTFGKGSVQNVIELEGGRSALKLTTSTYHRPSGRNIHREEGAPEEADWGVKPDDGFTVRMADEELTAWLINRRERDRLLVSHAPAAADPDLPPGEAPRPVKPARDRQLERALEHLRTKLAEAAPR